MIESLVTSWISDRVMGIRKSANNERGSILGPGSTNAMGNNGPVTAPGARRLDAF